MNKKNRAYGLSKLLLLLGVLLLVVTGCAKKTEKANFQKIANGVDSRVTYYYQDDKVVKQTTTNKIAYSALRVNNPAEAKKAIKSNVQKYNDTKGVTDKITYHDSYLDEHVTVDLSKASVKDFLKLSGTASTSDSKKKQFISFKKSAELVKDQGFKRIKDGKYKSLPKSALRVRKNVSMKQYNAIKLADDDKTGTTLAEVTKTMGKPDSSTEGSSSSTYTWYTNYAKSSYLYVSVNDKKQVQSKILYQPTAMDKKKFSAEKYNQINKEISADELISKLGAPYQITSNSSREMYFYIIEDGSGNQKQYVFQVENGKVTGKQSSSSSY